jgi:hypothetical protein
VLRGQPDLPELPDLLVLPGHQDQLGHADLLVLLDQQGPKALQARRDQAQINILVDPGAPLAPRNIR